MPATTVPAPVKESQPPVEVERTSKVRLYRNARAPHRGRQVLAGWIGESDPLLPDALQVASELLTNAVVHPARGPGRESVMLRLSRGEAFLLLEVIDPGSVGGCSLMQPTPPDFAAETGRGLGIVAAYASAWGTCTSEAGRRTVWAVLDRDARQERGESRGTR
ncbi:ATP-binding protein [Nonomuraea sp. NN258]|uniref:ATP-binding protein n=1 Tax=Nonomuraea antri TaxID=2730852 RepID=UPI0015682C51|nr:ATP-binding protein [Nonomuraea antri]NRQ39379.1 ATP-binding protein [Nonomuraea antri]